MVIYSLYILNKAGGLVFQRDFGTYVPQQQTPPYRKPKGNQYLTLASTFHGLHVISSQLSPLRDGGGIELLETDTFKLYCFAAPTSTKFFMITDVQQQNLDQLGRAVYDLYADYVMKNPFYEVEMPIHCELFSVYLDKKMEEINVKRPLIV